MTAIFGFGRPHLLVCVLAMMLHAGEVDASEAMSADWVLARALVDFEDTRVETNSQPVRVLKLKSSSRRGAAIIYLHGDLGITPPTTESDRALENRTLAARLDLLHRFGIRYGLPVYFLARPGHFGSPGSRRERRSKATYETISAAIDSIVGRDHLVQVAVVGQSGGANAAVAHAILGRSEAAKCYALSSGGYVSQYLRDHRTALAQGRTLDKAPLPPLEPTRLYDIVPHIAGIAPRPDRRFFVIADRRDRIAPFLLSEMLVEELAAKGHDATLIEARASGKSFHELSDQALIKAADCLGVGPNFALSVSRREARQHAVDADTLASQPR